VGQKQRNLEPGRQMSKKLKKRQKPETIKLKEHFISFHSISFDFDAKKVQRRAAKEKPLAQG